MNINQKIAAGVGALLFGAILFSAKPKPKKSVALAIYLYKSYKLYNENSSEFQNVLTAMWRNVGYSETAAKDAIKKELPWSAAFISFLFQDYPSFPKSASHSNYIVSARDNTKSNTGIFRLRKISDYKPQIGDIVCKTRGGVNVTYDSITRGTISHCDIIVAKNENELVTIGGNVSNKIEITKVPIINGYINKAGYFAVIQHI